MTICRAEFKSVAGSIFEATLSVEHPAKGLEAFFVEVTNARTKNRLSSKFTYHLETAREIWRNTCSEMAKACEDISVKRFEKDKEQPAVAPHSTTESHE